MEHDSTCRTFHIDITAPDAGLQLLAIMCWPRDPEARRHFLVTSAASAELKVKAGHVERADQLLEARLHLLLPTGGATEVVDAIAAYETMLLAWEVNRVTAAVTAEMEARHYEPYGGKEALLFAPPPQDIFCSAEAEGGKYGAACGEILGYIAMMHRHHPELNPSINLATHIMVARGKSENRRIPADRDRKKMWREWGWGGVAHLWAAYKFTAVVPGTHSGPVSGTHREPVKLILQYAHSLADFAVEFRSEQSHKWLLTEAEVVRVNPELPPLDAPIPPLTDQQLGWARSYENKS